MLDALIADTFALNYASLINKSRREGRAATILPVQWTASGLLHPSFRQEKFRNPQRCTDEEAECRGFEGTAKPRYWQQPIGRIGDADTGRGLENFDFIQWMQTAALPNFRKLYRKLIKAPGGTFGDGLPAGNYTLVVRYSERVGTMAPSNGAARRLQTIRSAGTALASFSSSRATDRSAQKRIFKPSHISASAACSRCSPCL